MTDEEMAEEYLKETFGLYCPTDQERYQVEQAFLAGLKEGSKLDKVWCDYDAGEDCYEDTHEGRWVKREAGREWHDLRKNPEDLPPHEESVKDLSVDVTVVARSARVTAFYDFKNRIWLDCHFWRLIPGVTAWCEIPEFVEEE